MVSNLSRPLLVLITCVIGILIAAPIIISASPDPMKISWMPIAISCGPVGDHTTWEYPKVRRSEDDVGRLIFFSQTEDTSITAVTFCVRSGLTENETSICLVEAASGKVVAIGACSTKNNRPRLVFHEPLRLPNAVRDPDARVEYRIRINSSKLSEAQRLGISLWRVEGVCGVERGTLPWVPLYDHIECSYR